MYCIDPHFSPIGSFTEAHDRWSNAKSFPKGGDRYGHQRQLDGPRKPHMSIDLLSEGEVSELYRYAYGTRGEYQWRMEPSELHYQMLEENKNKVHIGCTLHSTDVVTYREDGVVFIKSHDSRSTEIFASMALPDGVHFKRWDGSYYVGCHNGSYADQDKVYFHTKDKRVYCLRPSYILGLKKDIMRDGNWYPINGDVALETYDMPVLNHKLGRAALRRYNFSNFQSWARVSIPMFKIPYGDRPDASSQSQHLKYPRQGQNPLVELLTDPARWVELTSISDFWPDMFNRNSRSKFDGFNRRTFERRWALDRTYPAKLHARKLCSAVKLAVYAQEDCVRSEPHDFVTNWEGVQNYNKLTERYCWL